MSISSHLPDLTDAYIKARTERLALDQQVAALKEQETVLKDAIISKMKNEGLSAVGGAAGMVKLKFHDEPTGEDWPTIWEYIKQHDAFDLLHRRLTSEAVKARWEGGETIPGVGKRSIPKLTVSTT